MGWLGRWVQTSFPVAYSGGNQSNPPNVERALLPVAVLGQFGAVLRGGCAAGLDNGQKCPFYGGGAAVGGDACDRC